MAWPCQGEGTLEVGEEFGEKVDRSGISGIFIRGEAFYESYSQA